MRALIGALLALAAASGQDSEAQLRKGTSPVDAYKVVDLRGFRVHVLPDLMEGGDQESVGARALDALERDLAGTLNQVPESARAFLQTVPVYLNVADPVTPCACYHVSGTWLSSNGYDRAKEGAVEIGSALTYLNWRRAQPSMLLHELSHAYHHKVVGKDDPRLTVALANVRERGVLDAVRRWSGHIARHYALTNVEEYFAETTEALLATNDFYPFVRGELLATDPDGARLVAELWGAKDPLETSPMIDMQDNVRSEIQELHAAFVRWFDPTSPSPPAEFERIESALAPSFAMVTPSGDLIDRTAVLGALSAAKDARTVAIEIDVKTVTMLGDSRVMAVYEERQSEDGATRVIVSTVVFQAVPSAPNGIRWLHVHETLASPK